MNTSEACRNPITQQRLVHLSQNQGRSGKGSNNGTCYMLHIPICSNRMHVKHAGHYHGPLVIFTVVQCWVDFEGSVKAPGYISNNDFPLAVLAVTCMFTLMMAADT